MNNFVVMRVRNCIIICAMIKDDPFEVPSVPKDLSSSLVGNDLTVVSTREKTTNSWTGGYSTGTFYILLYYILNQIIIQVLASHTPRNVQKRKRTKKESLPEGAARYLPNSPEYLDLLAERASRKVEKKVKKTK